MITQRRFRWFNFVPGDFYKLRHSIRALILVALCWLILASAAVAAGRLCGAKTYFPPGTVYKAFVEDDKALSDFKMTLTSAVVLKNVPPTLASHFDTMKPSTAKEIDIAPEQAINLKFADVLPAKGSMTFQRRGALMLQTGGKYYLLEHKEKEQIAGVLKPGMDGTIVKLKPSIPGRTKLKAKFEIDQNGEKSITLLPGGIIIMPIDRPLEFDLNLTGGVYLYNTVDFFHRAKLEIEEPIRTPPKDTFIAVMRKLDTDFTGSNFVACARPSVLLIRTNRSMSSF